MTRFWDGQTDRQTDGQTDGVTALLDLLSPSATQVKMQTCKQTLCCRATAKVLLSSDTSMADMFISRILWISEHG